MPVYWASSAGTITAAGSGLTTELAVSKLAMTWLGADPDALSSVTTVTSTSKKEEILCNVVYDSCRKALLEDHNWQFAKRFLQLNLADGYDESYFDEITITGITGADPAVVTAASHGFLDGWLVKIYDVVGMTEINNRVVRVANKDTDTFECYGLNSSKFTAYASGGKCIRYEALADYTQGYVYDVPEDFLRPVYVEGRPKYEVVGSGDNRRILCTALNPVIEYVADVSTVSEMPEHFKRAWAARIAAELANPLQKKNAAMKDMWAHYEQVLKKESEPSDSRNADARSLIKDDSPTFTAGGWE